MAKIFINPTDAKSEILKVYENSFPEIKNEVSLPFLVVYHTNHFQWLWVTEKLIITWDGDKKFIIDSRDKKFCTGFDVAIPETTGYFGTHKAKVIDFNEIEVDDQPIKSLMKQDFIYNDPH